MRGHFILFVQRARVSTQIRSEQEAIAFLKQIEVTGDN
jgi:hypothetical protein